MDVDFKCVFEIWNCVWVGQDCEIEYQDFWYVFQFGDFIVQCYEMMYVFCFFNVVGG